ncbi:MAG: Com family DNA-binding transcriptional regulator [Deltaproteobacteria bacterium]|nr:Com family DNA-binding transcriptional regulator [Deltaproteobacteria bacterium]
MVKPTKNCELNACAEAGKDLRCEDCHKLLARVENDRLVIRCARCKSEIRIRMSEMRRNKGEWFGV